MSSDEDDSIPYEVEDFNARKEWDGGRSYTDIRVCEGTIYDPAITAMAGRHQALIGLNQTSSRVHSTSTSKCGVSPKTTTPAPLAHNID